MLAWKDESTECLEHREAQLWVVQANVALGQGTSEHLQKHWHLQAFTEPLAVQGAAC